MLFKCLSLACAVFAALTTTAEIEGLNGPWLEKGDTLLCFGDSLTANGDYVKALEVRLSERGVRVVNGGLSGDKTPMALMRIARVLDEVNPTAILFFFGANDAVIGHGVWRDEPVVSAVTYRDNLVWMIHYCRLATKVRKFSIAPPTGSMEGEQHVLFGDIRRDYCQMAREAADGANAVFVPLDIVFDQARRSRSADEKGHTLTRDGIHLNKQGAQLAAETMLRVWNMDR